MHGPALADRRAIPRLLAIRIARIWTSRAHATEPGQGYILAVVCRRGLRSSQRRGREKTRGRKRKLLYSTKQSMSYVYICKCMTAEGSTFSSTHSATMQRSWSMRHNKHLLRSVWLRRVVPFLRLIQWIPSMGPAVILLICKDPEVCGTTSTCCGW